MKKFQALLIAAAFMVSVAAQADDHGHDHKAGTPAAGTEHMAEGAMKDKKTAKTTKSKKASKAAETTTPAEGEAAGQKTEGTGM